MRIVQCCTNDPTLRSSINGWTKEDTDLFEFGREIGFTSSPSYDETYDTPFEYLARKWKLLNQPIYDVNSKQYEWFFYKD